MPKVAWKFDCFNNLIPKLDYYSWNNIQNYPWIIDLSSSQLLEVIFQLGIVEAWKNIFPNQQILWTGALDWKPLIQRQNILYDQIDIPKYSAGVFPTVCFKLQTDYIMWNTTLNCVNVRSLQGKKSLDIRPISKQILEKSLLSLIPKNLPIWRLQSSYSEKFLTWLKMNDIDLLSPYQIWIDNSGFTIHSPKFEFSLNKLIQLHKLSSNSVKIVVVNSTLGLPIIKNLFWLPKEIFSLLDLALLIEKSSLLFSREIDWMYYGLCFSNARLISYDYKKPFSLSKNKLFLNRTNEIISLNKKKLSVMFLKNYV